MARRKPQQISLLGESSAEHTRRAWKGAVRASSRSKALSPAPRPWRAVVLGVDQASKRSGWCIKNAGKYVDSAELDTFDVETVRRVIGAALTLAQSSGLPCVLVLEGHSMRAFGPHSFAIPSYLVAAKRLWLTEWAREAKPHGHAGKHCVAALSSWRAAVLGGAYVRKSREECRDAERLAALAQTDFAKHPLALGGDEAPAICIATYGAQSPEVGKLIGKRAQKASLDAWLRARP